VIVVFLVLLFVTLGGFLFVPSGINAVGDSTDPDVPIEVSPGVFVTPLQGWEVGETVAGTPQHVLRLVKGNGILDVFSISFSGTATDLYLAYVNEILSVGATQLQFQEEPEPIQLPSGLLAARGGYSGTFEGVSAPIEGEVTGVLTAIGEGLAFDGWAQQGQYGFVADEVRQMVDTTERG
jgi:hypothetical protein